MTSTRRLVQQMHPSDNVATALMTLAPGTVVSLPTPASSADAGSGETPQVTVVSEIPFGHKVALTAIRPGEPVRKYGEEIGLASAEIAAGEHVHTHNVESQRGRGDLHR